MRFLGEVFAATGLKPYLGGINYGAYE
ncbi:hypothetical protein SPHINGOT1_110054 [Sphingomonas sp. T1]|nr:hypothetical protein SPHINGOT1_110054 [Sphingomonas sp. T1]